MYHKQPEVENIVTDLKNLRLNTSDLDAIYAIDANIGFYNSLNSIFSYIRWLIKIAPNLNPKKLLEINDLLPKYDGEMHKYLIKVERNFFPGLLNGIVNFIYLSIINHLDIKVLGSVGSGGMELERQVIEKLLNLKKVPNITFVAFDKSKLADLIAKNNLSEFKEKITTIDIENLTQDNLDRITLIDGIKVIFAKNDIFKLGQDFKENTFDLVYSSLFMHHMDTNKYENLNNNFKIVSKKHIEYDGCRKMFLLVPQSITGWVSPILLNASVFSGLRYKEKKILLKNNPNNKIKFFLIGTYLLEYKKIR